MTVHLSVAVMHHPRRAARMPALLSALGPFPVTVIEDTDSEGAWPTAVKAWGSIHPGATHQLVLQDDVIPCRDALLGAVRALQVKQAVPVCFYANRAVCEAADAAGKAWALIADGMWGPASCLPVPLLHDFMAWQARHIREGFPHDDSRLALWAVITRRPVWCTVPSLFDHDDAGESILKNRSPTPRVARRFLGANGSALRVDWRKGAEDPPRDMSKGVMRYAAEWFVA